MEKQCEMVGWKGAEGRAGGCRDVELSEAFMASSAGWLDEEDRWQKGRKAVMYVQLNLHCKPRLEIGRGGGGGGGRKKKKNNYDKVA